MIFLSVGAAVELDAFIGAGVRVQVTYSTYEEELTV